MNDRPEPSEWQRLASRVRRGLAGMRGARAAADTIREYARVIPVLAGQVREAASTMDETTQRLHDREDDDARRSLEAAARLKDAIGASKVVSATTTQVDRWASGLQSLARNAELESAQPGDPGAGFAVLAYEISLQADEATAVARGIRDTVEELERSLALAAASLQDLLEADGSNLAGQKAADEHATALLRLRTVIETLSEMQDEFVTALERPDARMERPDSAALRLRRRYTAASASR